MSQFNSTTELIEYFNGRTLATTHALAILVAKRDVSPEYIISYLEGNAKRVASASDGTPDGQAHAAGYQSAIALLHETLEAATSSSLMLSLDDKTVN